MLRLKKSPTKDFVSLKRQIQEDERRKNRIQKNNVSRKSRIDGLFGKKQSSHQYSVLLTFVFTAIWFFYMQHQNDQNYLSCKEYWQYILA